MQHQKILIKSTKKLQTIFIIFLGNALVYSFYVLTITSSGISRFATAVPFQKHKTAILPITVAPYLADGSFYSFKLFKVNGTTHTVTNIQGTTTTVDMAVEINNATMLVR